MPLLTANHFFGIKELMNAIIDSTIAASTSLYHTVSRSVPVSTAAVSDSICTEEEVYLTQQATCLASVQRALEPTPPLDTTRIETLRHALAEGSYSINPQTIAQRMLEWDRQLA